MKRGDFYRVVRPGRLAPGRLRVFLVVSRQVLIDSKFSTVICAPVYSAHHGLSTQISVGAEERLRQESSVHCDELVSLPKSVLARFVGTLAPHRFLELDKALIAAVGVELSI